MPRSGKSSNRSLAAERGMGSNSLLSHVDSTGSMDGTGSSAGLAGPPSATRGRAAGKPGLRASTGAAAAGLSKTKGPVSAASVATPFAVPEAEHQVGLAWTHLTEEICAELQTLEPDQVLVRIAQILDIPDWQTSMQSEARLSFYANAYFMAQMHKMPAMQTSAVFSIYKLLVDTCLLDELPLEIAIVLFQRLLTEHTGGLSRSHMKGPTPLPATVLEHHLPSLASRAASSAGAPLVTGAGSVDAKPVTPATPLAAAATPGQATPTGPLVVETDQPAASVLSMAESRQLAEFVSETLFRQYRLVTYALTHDRQQDLRVRCRYVVVPPPAVARASADALAAGAEGAASEAPAASASTTPSTATTAPAGPAPTTASPPAAGSGTAAGAGAGAAKPVPASPAKPPSGTPHGASSGRAGAPSAAVPPAPPPGGQSGPAAH
ncbi:hypothetical protein CXG81DRAFT_25686 [Caulochytrium protostelioides]|uniref:Uncharacterized protein n=1 Tax=Caulochytrium protostelioides TaxID=1555241 RepID=A0A4P9X8R3_9FUNG|nr:hypothetical protein CXG81DRAFT_25686 [Caulochytrium protostelioides]|eukprot:RKP01652.1 hypothetical protein CXG81DRAFT_25686 [Caulochytrium protostelioides]